MLQFFAPTVPAGPDRSLTRVVIEFSRWRSVMARISSSFSTSLSDLIGMPWDEALRWFPEAKSIYSETWGKR